MSYTLKFYNDDEPFDIIIDENVKDFASASAIVEADAQERSEGGEAVLVDNETGEIYYYCISDEGDWFPMD